MHPPACFQRSELGFILLFAMTAEGMFVALCAGVELVCLVGRVTWESCERIIISECCSKF